MPSLFDHAKILERKLDELNEKVDTLLEAQSDSKDDGGSDEDNAPSDPQNV